MAMTAIRAACLLAGLGFAGIIIRAFGTDDFGASFSAILADPWGIVALADLYLGCLLFAFIIAGFEGSAARAMAWIIALVILGNMISAIWLALNAPRLWQRLRGRCSDGSPTLACDGVTTESRPAPSSIWRTE